MADNKNSLARFLGGIREAARKTGEHISESSGIRRSAHEDNRPVSKSNRLCLENDRYLDYLLQPEVLQAVKHEKSNAFRQECMVRKGQEIRRAYYQKGGIRFYAQQLVDYVSSISDQDPTAEEMWVSAYNSLIVHMCESFEELQKKCKTFDEESVKDHFSSKRSVLKAIGYEEYHVAARFFEYGAYRKESPEVIKVRLSQLERITETNRKAYEDAKAIMDKAMRGSESRDISAASEFDELFQAMECTLNQDIVKQLRSAENITDQEYRDSLITFCEKLQKELLTPYQE